MPDVDWRVRVAGFFRCESWLLDPLSNVFEDLSCWFASPLLPGAAHIQVPMPDARGATGYLSRADAGATLPRHVHEARESCLVLLGGFLEEESGRHFGVGEVLVSEPGSAHRVRVDPDSPCIVAIRIDFVARAKRGPLDKGLRLVESTLLESA